MTASPPPADQSLHIEILWQIYEAIANWLHTEVYLLTSLPGSRDAKWVRIFFEEVHLVPTKCGFHYHSFHFAQFLAFYMHVTNVFFGWVNRTFPLTKLWLRWLFPRTETLEPKSRNRQIFIYLGFNEYVCISMRFVLKSKL